MATVPTQITVTPTFDGLKQMTVVGTMALNEHVQVTVVGMADVADELVLRLTSHTGVVEFARFPAELEDAWTVSGDDLTCTLKLNTTALQAAFRNLYMANTVAALVLLENGTTDNLYAVGMTALRNWIQNPLDPVAGSSQLQNQIDVLTERIGTHQHDNGAESASFPHNNLLLRDAAGAHPTIEAGVANANAVANQALEATQTLGNNKADKPAPATLTALANLGTVPLDYTDADIRTTLNAVVVLLNALGTSL